MKTTAYIFIFVGLLGLVLNIAWLSTGDRPNLYMRGGMSGFWLSTGLGAALLVSGISALLVARRHR